MTKATPFLQNTILLSYDPRPSGSEDFLVFFQDDLYNDSEMLEQTGKREFTI